MNATTYNLLNSEIEKRIAVISEMNEKANWTKEMEKLEDQLNVEIYELTQSFNELNKCDGFYYVNSQY